MSDLISARQTARRLEDAVRTVVRGQDAALRNILASLAAGGHVLVEDVPGTGKTTLAKAIARAVDGAAFKRVQFTPDLLPGDILGVSIFDPRSQEFRFRPGPIFADILLADEINRASPRTQSALLEAMAERQATIDGERHDLNGLFFVIATQNPVEFRGTYPLPEAQMDRFMVQSRLGYVTPEEERSILSDQIDTHPVDRLQPVINRDDLVGLLEATRTVRISDELRGYIVDIVSATRGRDDVQLAASPRASIALMKMSQALSLFEGREFVVPETIQAVAADVIAHRMVIAPEAKLSGVTGRQIIADLLTEIPVPV
ncbi:MoxR family ATPase [Luteolibacter flavescens]|uniref:MoxR family ATPase n=1 Tax=Luteolibacter flavescens TaxID=1859460 RepID=A0ABT3FVZ3_9BACT|nr:MoxR family ATPase [Luteolibacter flavescens]MCW1887572.1 MoxR family ATPase [Luteolibacter flavescens]